jgi:hypothetical protein
MNLKLKLAQAFNESETVIEQLVNRVNGADLSLKEAEQQIQEHVQQLGQLMMDKVMAHVKKPDLALENSIIIGNKEYRYNGNKYMRIRNALKNEKAS